MKNSIKVVFLAIALASVVSCVENKPSYATFSVGSSFELLENEWDTYMVDSVMYSPQYSWEEVICYYTQCSNLNVGYEGGFKLSAKFGVDDIHDPNSYYTSAGPSAGAAQSACYLAYLQTGSMPRMDVTLNMSSYSKADSQIIGFYINNTAYTEKLYRAGELHSGDFLKVTVSFFNNGTFVGSASKYLVNGIGKLDDSIDVVTDWDPWDISKEGEDQGYTIGTFDSVKFEVQTSGGKLMPCFCLDNFLVQLSVEY